MNTISEPLPSQVVRTTREYLEKAIFILENARDCLPYVDETVSVEICNNIKYTPWLEDMEQAFETAERMVRGAKSLLMAYRDFGL